MPKLESKPLASIHPDPNQPRKTFDEVELRQLGESLRLRQNDPVQIMPDGTIIDGERRWRAAKLVGLEKLDVIITDRALSAEELSIIRLSTFLHRVGLEPFEECQALAEALKLNPAWDQKTLAQKLGLDPSSITRKLSPTKCIPEAVKALKAAKITISDCYAISKLPTEDQPGLLALKLSGQITGRDEMEQHARKTRNTAKNGDTDTERTEKLPVALSAGTVIIKAKKGEEPLNLAAAKVLLVEAQAKVESAIRLGYSTRTAVHAWDETKHNVRKPRKPRTAKESA